MKLAKAIEILADIILMFEHEHIEDDKDAMKLGIEAMKKVINARHGDPALDGELLLGETEE